MTKVSDSLMEGSTTIILSQPVYSSVLPPYNFFMAVYFDVSLDHKILCEWLHLMYGIKMVCGLEEWLWLRVSNELEACKMFVEPTEFVG